MPISNYPFKAYGRSEVFRPYLPIVIHNPDTGHRLKLMALIDTGADDCALPASYASILGHNLQMGRTSSVGTGNGTTTAYAHTTKIEVVLNKKPVYTMQNTPIDFMPNLSVPLLGVKSFLENFILTIDYKKKCFSLRQ